MQPRGISFRWIQSGGLTTGWILLFFNLVRATLSQPFLPQPPFWPMVPLNPARSTRTFALALTLYDSGHEARPQPDGCLSAQSAAWARASAQDNSLARLFAYACMYLCPVCTSRARRERRHGLSAPP